MSGSANIELSGVDVAHEDRPAVAVLDSVDWSIGRGERWVVCGGAGAGKTSLLSTGAGLNQPLAGTLLAFGRDYWRSSEAERLALGRRIGFVFDDDGRVFAHMSVLENLTLPIQYHTNCSASEARARALELLAWVELESSADLAPVRLPTAMRRRVALARSLTQPVEVLFVDAMLVGLAPQDEAWWLERMRGLSRRDEAEGGPVSIVASGFDLSAWVDWADRFAVVRSRSFHPLTGSEARALDRRRPHTGA